MEIHTQKNFFQNFHLISSGFREMELRLLVMIA